MTAYVFTASRLKISLIPKFGIFIKTNDLFGITKYGFNSYIKTLHAAQSKIRLRNRNGLGTFQALGQNDWPLIL